MKRSIWEGVYKSFKDVPCNGSGFQGDIWIQNSIKKLKELQEISNQHTLIPHTPCYQESLLPILSAILKSKRNKVKILDFGGGLGTSYFQVCQSQKESTGLEFSIIEVKEVCQAGRLIFKNDDKINFDSNLPRENERFDIIHMGSSLHYVEKWQAMLNKLCRYEAQYFLITDLPAGDIQTFVTAQKYYDSKIPVWFFNINDVLESMAQNQYQCIFKSTFKATLNGKTQKLPLANFDKKYRLRHSCTILFTKREPK